MKGKLWEKYGETKQKCEQVVQRRRTVGKRTLQTLKRSGRAAPKKFWRQMKRLGRPTAAMQHLKSSLTLQVVKDDEFLSLVLQTGAKLLQGEAHLGDPRYETTASTAESVPGRRVLGKL